MAAKRNLERIMTPTRILSLGFLLIITLGAILLMLPVATTHEGRMDLIDAFFIATSATCVTGLSVIEPGRDLTLFGQVVMMVLIQTGGLGFMTLGSLLFIALRRRITMRERILVQQSLGEEGLGGMVKLVRRVALVTFSVEGIGALLLMLRFIPDYGLAKGIFASVFHAVSAFCNAGFDILGGTAKYAGDPIFNFVIAALITIGGLGFAVVYDVVSALRYREKKLSTQVKVVLLTSGALLVVGTVVFTLVEWNNPLTLGKLPPLLRPMAGMFESVTLRTAGFAPIKQADLNPASRIVALLFMFIGASPASTGGGIKTTTLTVLIMLLVSVFRGRENVTLMKRTIAADVVQRALVLTLVSLLLVLAATIALTFIMPQGGSITTESLLFEVISAFATVGLTMDVTMLLSAPAKVFIILLMYVGRLGPLTLVLALSQKQSRKQDRFKYPDCRMMIG